MEPAACFPAGFDRLEYQTVSAYSIGNAAACSQAKRGHASHRQWAVREKYRKWGGGFGKPFITAIDFPGQRHGQWHKRFPSAVLHRSP